LSAAENARVEAALAADPELADTLARIEEERIESILENEARPQPAAGAFDRLLDRIETEAPRADRSQQTSWASRLLGAIGGLNPRTVALAGVAAALVIVAEGGFLAGLVIHQNDQGVRYETASVNGPGAEMAYLLVQFSGDASIDKIVSYLR